MLFSEVIWRANCLQESMDPRYAPLDTDMSDHQEHNMVENAGTGSTSPSVWMAVVAAQQYQQAGDH